MEQIQTPTAPAQAPSSPAPPPLPLPGPDVAREQLPGERPEQRGSRSEGYVPALGGQLRTYLVFMAFFTALWAVGGGGHFWPVWPMLGWGMHLVVSGQVPLGVPRRRTR